MSNKNFSIINAIMLTVIFALAISLACMFGYQKYQRNTQEDSRLGGAILSEKNTTEDFNGFEALAEAAKDDFEQTSISKEQDLCAIENGLFQDIHLSMWSLEMCNRDWYYTLFAKDIFYSNYEIKKPQDLCDYLLAIDRAEVKPANIYLGIDPYLLAEAYYEYEYYDLDTQPYEEYVEEYILSFVEANPSISFHVFFPIKPLSFWSKMDDFTYESYWDLWYRFSMSMRWWPNVHISYIGAEEWLISNDNNFISENCLIDELALQTYIYLYAFEEYEITPPELILKKDSIYELSRKSAPKYGDDGFRNREIVFYGDGVITYNQIKSVSIPGYVEGITKTKIEDLTVGGTTACRYGENSFSVITGENTSYSNPAFVISYGLSDYFNGLSLRDFESGLKQGIENIRNLYENADVLLIVPYSTVVGNGGNEALGEKGGLLDDYRNIIENISQEYSAKLLNLDAVFDVNSENEYDYLADGTHPRYWFTLEIAKLVVEKLLEE